MATEKPLELSRVAVGSGTIDEAANLADQHELIVPVAYGTIVDRRHSGDYLYLTAQYDNSDETNRDVGMFYLAEFIVYAKHPVSGEEIDLLYATLGDYKQPVPAYSETEPPCVFKFPMVLVVSDQIEVKYSGAPGLVTRDDMRDAMQLLYEQIKSELSGSNLPTTVIKEITIPHEGWTWQEPGEADEEIDEYRYFVDVALEEATEAMYPSVALHKSALETAKNASLCPCVQAMDGALRFWAKQEPEADMAATAALTGAGGSTSGGGPSSALPIASATRLGGVKIGKGITVAEDGTISASDGGVNPDNLATSEDTSAMLDEIFPAEDET